MIHEYVCERCGQSFNGDGEPSEGHWTDNCGGNGYLNGTWN